MTESIIDKADGTIGKALDVLDLVASIGRPAKFTRLLDASTLPKATLHRLLKTLTRQHMLAYDTESQTYSLGVRLVRLAHSAWQMSSPAPIAKPFIKALSELTHETVHLAQLDNGHVLYIDKYNARRPLNMFSEAGKIGPVHCTGVGKAMMAFLDSDQLKDYVDQQNFHGYTKNTLTDKQAFLDELAHIREDGIAFDNEEHEDNIICIAAPILSKQGRVIGGLSITTSLQRYSLDELRQFKPKLIDTAKKIAAQSETWRFPTL